MKMTFPLPKILDRLVCNCSVLYLGCSLTADRTIQILMRVVGNRERETQPPHYALLSAPDDADRRSTPNRRLADANIAPLWYPNGQHQSFGEVLELLSTR
ncbi:MAG: SIR2 family protein [Planctomycetota bacterium]|nr:SIR2 family protein [Planctomycetota bacterium]